VSRFMDIVKTVGEVLREPMVEFGQEMKRLGVQGQMELASAIFNGQAFVPYGPGQKATEAEKAIEPPEPSIEIPERSM
jgi:hypothetical protein